MRAIILAGGKGTRLRPFTAIIPKPLVPIGDRAVLEVLLERLVKSQVKRVTICVNHLANLIMAYFADGERWGIKIDYSIENEPLGTAAPLRMIRDLPENFLVLNGDLVTDLDFKEFFDFHVKSRNLISVAVQRRRVHIDFGVFDVDLKSRRATAFREKPVQEHFVSMGVYGFNRRILDAIPEKGAFGFDQLMMDLMKRQQGVSIYPYDGYWLDIGRPEDYQKVIDDLENRGV